MPAAYSRWTTSALLLAAVVGCTARPAPPPPDPEAAACLTLFADQDRAIERAGVADAGLHRLPGFPYLRSDRLLASFRDELGSSARRLDWLRAMRELDQHSRMLELANLDGLAPDPHLRDELARCGEALVTGHALPRLDRVRRLAAVPDDYLTGARIFGLYPAALPFLKLGIARFHGHIEDLYNRPLRPEATDPERVLWLPERETPLNFAAAAQHYAALPRDALGIPRPDAATAAEMLARHAPAFWIETLGDADYIGAPHAGPPAPGVDPERPAIYTQIAHTRVGGEVLLQLVYTVWFDERPAAGWLDSYAGHLDGVIWRVTLSSDGLPWVYDTIHPCGCYHLVFPVAEGLTRRGGGLLGESPPQPQGRVGWWQPALAIRAGTHYIERILPLSAVQDAQRRARVPLKSYDELRSLPTADGRRSLFGPDGLVEGSERFERWWLWPSGVRDPGTMRQWGRQATAFVGRRHFDDPDLFEQILSTRHRR